MSGDSGIRFDRVSVAYDGTTVLDSLDLTVEPGEVMALLGPSGSGKTTALRAVAGFVRPASGRVFMGDRDVTALPPHRRGVGMVVQQYAQQDGVALFEPDWVDIDKDLTSYVEDWKTATGS